MNETAITKLNKVIDRLQLFDSSDSSDRLAIAIGEAVAEIEMIIDEWSD